MSRPERALVVAGALAGMAGVGLSAAAAHVNAGPTLDIAARFLLVHAAALLGVTALVAGGVLHRPAGRVAGLALVVGLALFCGDLALRGLLSVPLFPFAAPTGGTLLLGGWALVAVAAVLPVRR